MIEQVLDDDNVKKALDYLMSKKNSLSLIPSSLKKLRK